MDSVITTAKLSHTLLEDVLAILIGTLMVSFGIILLRQSGALTGGTAGMAFLLHYLTHVSFGIAFFLLNLPFYYLSIHRMGWNFTLKTFCAVALVSLFSDLHTLFIHIDHLNPFYATLFGNIIMGLGFIVLFRHKASLGGVNILALYLQDKYAIRAGKFQMAVDVTIVLASLFVVSIPMLITSVLGATILNLIIAMNHRPGRYTV
ncbi:YitT family protein [Pectobacteriaceae bacterium CE70]|uniref:YitT family protein n=1 Tax=Serratia sp. (strain ATCC 39006) TaxID=104623 RepID=A0A2I5T4N7_SERS3|nr:YitT family protein [Serratia sp. ATCC 39006]AUG99516.1 YitT family protein [Serratia sp. ATCC 39006]AUH03834.1 YitT family protein [Serratia sp. ATCC 39006]WJV66171.1 YitT family protein [Pectobacteriaceae bacterium CE70]WJY10182.1 YitT family protein [Pectobacteriaceae bacterium C80]